LGATNLSSTTYSDNKQLKRKFSKKSLNLSSTVVCRAIMELFLLMDKLGLEKHSPSQEELRGMSTEELFQEPFPIFLQRLRGTLPRVSVSAFPIWKYTLIRDMTC
jgi:hypothetical protein